MNQANLEQALEQLHDYIDRYDRYFSDNIFEQVEDIAMNMDPVSALHYVQQKHMEAIEYVSHVQRMEYAQRMERMERMERAERMARARRMTRAQSRSLEDFLQQRSENLRGPDLRELESAYNNDEEPQEGTGLYILRHPRRRSSSRDSNRSRSRSRSNS